MLPVVRSCVLIAAFACPEMIHAAGPVFTDPSSLELLWNEGEFTEGVASLPDGVIVFSDIAIAGKNPGRILKFDPATKKTSVLVADSGQSNGIDVTTDGRILAVCGANKGHRALCIVEADGTMKTIVGRFEGKLFNAPNDLSVHPTHGIYFSDPRYVGPEPLELDHQSVYLATLDGKVRRVTTSISKPNGVIVSPDGKTLYVAETDNGTTGVDPAGQAPKPPRFTLNAFPIKADGTLGDKRVLVDYGKEMGIDGMTVDSTGRIYAAIRKESRHGIAVYAPDGKEVDFLVMQPLPTNCSFGRGKEVGVLYITADSGLYRVPTKAQGLP